MIKLTVKQKQQSQPSPNQSQKFTKKKVPNLQSMPSAEDIPSNSEALFSQSSSRKDFRQSYSYRKLLKSQLKQQIGKWQQFKIYKFRDQKLQEQLTGSINSLYQEMGSFLEFIIKAQKLLNISNWRVKLSEFIRKWGKLVDHIVQVLKNHQLETKGVNDEILIFNAVLKKIKVLVDQMYKQQDIHKCLFLKSLMECQQKDIGKVVLTKLALVYPDQLQLQEFSDESFNPTQNIKKSKNKAYSTSFKSIFDDSYPINMKKRLVGLKIQKIRNNLIQNLQQTFPQIKNNTQAQMPANISMKKKVYKQYDVQKKLTNQQDRDRQGFI